MDISVVIPVYNEEKNVLVLHDKLSKVLKSLKKAYEIIFVDDGSTDKTYSNLTKIHKKNKNTKVIQFYRNFGKAAALSAGFEQSKGGIIITMDGDLQDDPKEIPRFIKKINEGYDLVNGWKHKRKDPLTKTLPSKIANFVTSYSTGAKLHDMNCGFKAYRREVTKSIKLYGDMHRYIPALAYSKGYRITEIKVDHHKRKYGSSKYGFVRLFRGLFDFITIKFLNDYIRRPMHFFGMIGGLLFVIGLVILTYLSILRLFYNILIGGRPLLLLGILLLILGFQFLSIGLIGEIFVNLSQEKEDVYNIKRILK